MFLRKLLPPPPLETQRRNILSTALILQLPKYGWWLGLKVKCLSNQTGGCGRGQVSWCPEGGVDAHLPRSWERKKWASWDSSPCPPTVPFHARIEYIYTHTNVHTHNIYKSQLIIDPTYFPKCTDQISQHYCHAHTREYSFLLGMEDRKLDSEHGRAFYGHPSSYNS